jgi:hypothetical protein
MACQTAKNVADIPTKATFSRVSFVAVACTSERRSAVDRPLYKRGVQSHAAASASHVRVESAGWRAMPDDDEHYVNAIAP